MRFWVCSESTTERSCCGSDVEGVRGVRMVQGLEPESPEHTYLHLRGRKLQEEERI